MAARFLRSVIIRCISLGVLAACPTAIARGQEQRSYLVEEQPTFGERIGAIFGTSRSEKASRAQPRNAQSPNSKSPNSPPQNTQPRGEMRAPQATARGGNPAASRMNTIQTESVQRQAQQPPRAGSTQWTSAFSADKRTTPSAARPSQVARPAPAGETKQRNATADNRRPQPQVQRSIGMQGSTPDEIDHNDVPMLARRPSFATVSPSQSPDDETDDLTPAASTRRTLQERLSAMRNGDSKGSLAPNSARQSAAASVPPAAARISSRRTNSFAGDPDSKVQHMINPTVAQNDVAQNDSADITPSDEEGTESTESPAPRTGMTRGHDITPVVADAGEERVSSRRGFSSNSTERLASASKPGFTGPVEANGVLIARQSPLLSVETTGPRSITIGKPATYTVTVRNTGEMAAQDLVVTVRVPEWADVLEARGSTGAAQLPVVHADAAGANQAAATNGAMQPVEWNLPRLEARSKEELTLRIVPRKSKSFDLAVQWTFTPPSSHAHVEVQEPKLAMNLAGPEEVVFGQTKIYKLTLANPGSGDAENVMIELAPLGDQTTGVTRHTIGTIPAGESKVIEVELTARNPGKVVIKALATADGDLSAEVAEEVLVRRAGLELAAVGSKLKYAGTVGAYRIAVANPGNATAENVQITATLPGGAKHVSSSGGGQASSDGSRVTWTVPALRAGSDMTFDLKCELDIPGVNRLQVQAKADSELTAVADAATQVEAIAELKLDVDEPKGALPVGDEVTYQVRVANRGSKAATQVTVVCYASEELEATSASGGAHQVVNGMVIFKPLAQLAAGAEAPLKVNLRAARAGKHQFRVSVFCAEFSDKDESGERVPLLSSQHTALFYGDELAKNESHSGHSNEENAQALVPRTSFEQEAQPRRSLQHASNEELKPVPDREHAPQVGKKPKLDTEVSPATEPARRSASPYVLPVRAPLKAAPTTGSTGSAYAPARGASAASRLKAETRQTEE